MPSFDVVSEVDLHEVSNAVDQANREVGQRYDFKGSDARYDQKENLVTLSAPSEFQLNQMLDILRLKLAKRDVDVACLKVDEPVMTGQTARQIVTLRRGIDTELAKRIQRKIKDSKLKVQASIQGDQVRIAGKKRDDLQAAISLIKSAEIDLPLQYTNFRD